VQITCYTWNTHVDINVLDINVLDINVLDINVLDINVSVAYPAEAD